MSDNEFKLTYKIDAGNLYTINEAKLELPIDYDEQNFLDVKNELEQLVNTTYSLNKITKVVEEIDKINLSREYDFINADILETKVGKDKLNL